MSELLTRLKRGLLEVYSSRKEEYLRTTIELLLSALLGFTVAGIFAYLYGYDPLKIYSVMIGRGYLNLNYLLAKTTPLLLAGLAFSIPQMAGVFNIGGESQLYWGAFIGLVTGYFVYTFTGMGLISTSVAILASLSAGAVWALVIAILRVYRGVNEVVVAIMLNWISYYAILYVIIRHFLDPKISHQSISMPVEARLAEPMGFAMAVIATGVIYYLLYYTKTGYEIRVSGLSPRSAAYAGIDSRRSILISMLLGGACAGLGGGLLMLTFSRSIDTTMSALSGYGFTGIGVGLIGRNHPVGIIFSALFVAGLEIGSQWVELATGAPPQLADAIIGIIVISLATPYAYHSLISWYRSRKEVRTK